MSDEMEDLCERLVKARTTLRDMAKQRREETLSRTFDGTPFSMQANRLDAKAEGVSLAISYVEEYLRAAPQPLARIRAEQTAEHDTNGDD